MDRRSICGCLFWLKTLLAMALALGALGGQAYFVYYKYKARIAEVAVQRAFNNATGGADDPNQGVTVVIDPTVCFAPAASIVRNATSLRAGVSNVITQGHRLEPPEGVRLFGFAIDYSQDTPVQLQARLGGREPPVIAGFVQITPTDLAENMANWFAQTTSEVNGILELTVMPNVTLSSFTQATWDNLAILMYRMNTRHGVPILLRFAHEMNGNWGPYGQRPVAFKAAWQALTKAVRLRTNMTAMVWGPNPGSGYPYGVSATQPVPAVASDEFRALDTNNDGKLDENDDPYGPFWPGEEYVDWVGMSMYNYGYSAATRNYVTIPANYIQTQLSGPWTGTTGAPFQDFYNRFVNQFAKPFIITESGSPYVVVPGANTATADEITQKRAWWRQMITFLQDPTYYPNLKAVVHFEEAKNELADTTVVYKDFTVTTKTGLRDLFLADIAAYERSTASQPGPITWGRSLNYTCNGQIRLI
ncbi:glycoside hydrolase superfamily [Cladochytrium replicatum]|nr:glycoside hydrolase superfamily [Cladochytrium replicatum]